MITVNEKIRKLLNEELQKTQVELNSLKVWQKVNNNPLDISENEIQFNEEYIQKLKAIIDTL